MLNCTVGHAIHVSINKTSNGLRKDTSEEKNPIIIKSILIKGFVISLVQKNIMATSAWIAGMKRKFTFFKYIILIGIREMVTFLISLFYALIAMLLGILRNLAEYLHIIKFLETIRSQARIGISLKVQRLATESRTDSNVATSAAHESDDIVRANRQLLEAKNK